jgi:glycolate oxidase FAD binding subunit
VSAAVAVDSLDALRDAVRGHARVWPVGAGTKPALSVPPRDDVVSLDVSGLRGIVDYDPAELTLTARAGTPIAELEDALGAHGQYLPFDPPLAAAGATLGGVVAAGTSGPGAFHYGTVRDFVIGVRFVDGAGELVAGGGRVVKNAAGFDLPKLMVGSCGRLGVLAEVALKVFPRPAASATVAFELGTTDAALAAIATLARGPLELDALDLEPPGRVLARIAGDADGLSARAARLAAALAAPAVTLADDAARASWNAAAELSWVPAGARAVRVATTAREVPALQAALAAAGAQARYANAANVAWVAWPDAQPLARLDETLAGLQLTGVALTGPPHAALLGARRGGAFAARLRAALDPDERFPED